MRMGEFLSRWGQNYWDGAVKRKIYDVQKFMGNQSQFILSSHSLLDNKLNATASC